MGNWDTTIIVSGLKKVPVRRYTVSPAFFGVVCGGLTVFLTLTGLSTFHYYRMWQRSADYEVLQSKFETLHRSTEDVRLQARQLSERLSSFEVSTQKLRVVTGLNEEGLGGVGGPDEVLHPGGSVRAQGGVEAEAEAVVPRGRVFRD